MPEIQSFKLTTRFLEENGKRNITVTHLPTNLKITSPDYFVHEKSDAELKKNVWEIMKTAIKVFK